MPEIEPEDDGTLDPDEEARAATLTEAQLRTIDECILSNITHRLQKTARVVVLTMRTLGGSSRNCRTSSIPDASSIPSLSGISPQPA